MMTTFSVFIILYQLFYAKRKISQGGYLAGWNPASPMETEACPSGAPGRAVY